MPCHLLRGSENSPWATELISVDVDSESLISKAAVVEKTTYTQYRAKITELKNCLSCKRPLKSQNPTVSLILQSPPPLHHVPKHHIIES